MGIFDSAKKKPSLIWLGGNKYPPWPAPCSVTHASEEVSRIGKERRIKISAVAKPRLAQEALSGPALFVINFKSNLLFCFLATFPLFTQFKLVEQLVTSLVDILFEFFTCLEEWQAFVLNHNLFACLRISAGITFVFLDNK